MDDSIYGDIGEYKPSRRFDQGASSSKTDDNQGKHRYFDKSNEEEERETGTIQSMLRVAVTMRCVIKFLSTFQFLHHRSCQHNLSPN